MMLFGRVQCTVVICLAGEEKKLIELYNSVKYLTSYMSWFFFLLEGNKMFM